MPLQIKYTAACAEIQLQTGYRCRGFGYNPAANLCKRLQLPLGQGDVVDPFSGADAQGAQRHLQQINQRERGNHDKMREKRFASWMDEHQ